MLKKKSYQKTIGFVTEGLTFNGNSINEKSLGGSETALLYMAKELSALGNKVIVMCQCDKPGNYDGVEYAHIESAQQIAKAYEFDVLIVSRFYEFLPKRWNTAMKVLWNHDTPTDRNGFLKQVYDTDIFFCLSDYHIKLYKDAFPEIGDYIEKTSNGLDWVMIDRILKKNQNIHKNPNKVMYMSRPERGLLTLLTNIFPTLKKVRPNLELMIVGYDLGNFPVSQETKQLYDHIGHLIKTTPGVYHGGTLTKKDYYKNLAESAAVLYPTLFPEISPCRGDTLIETPKGQFQIRDLAGKKDFKVYSCNENGELSLSNVNGVFLTRKNTDMLKVTFSNGTTKKAKERTILFLTPDHEVMLSDGTYKRADNLKVDDSVKALHRYVNGWDKGYDMIGLTGNKMLGEHRFLASHYFEREIGKNEHVHHKDKNTKNNSVGNLEIIKNGEHLNHHLNEYLKRVPKEQRNLSDPIGKRLTDYRNNLSSTELTKQAKKASNTFWETYKKWNPEKQKEWAANRVKATWETRKKNQLLSNHKVISIEKADNADAYCMEVEPDHNFIANGIVVHNCISAMEAQALKTPFLTTNEFALKETVQIDDWKLNGNPNDPEYQAKFATMALNWLNPNTQQYKEATSKARDGVKKYDWAKIAKQWNELFEDYLFNRLDQNPVKVLKNMMWNSDLVSAKKLCDELVSPDELGASNPFPKEFYEEKARIESFIAKQATAKEEYDENTAEDLSRLRDPKLALHPNFGSGRFMAMANRMKPTDKLLDIGTHYGEFPIWLSHHKNGINITAVDISENCIKKANESKNLLAKEGSPIAFDVKSLDDLTYSNEFDCVSAGELMEHMPDTTSFLKKLESFAKVGGRIVLSIPTGPWESVSFNKHQDMRFHIHNFTFNDVTSIFGNLKDMVLQQIVNGVNSRGESLGWWIVSWTKDPNNKFGEVDHYRKWLSYKPYQSVAVCMIAKNEEENIIKCLKSLRDVFDEVNVLDTGSTDKTVELAKYCGANVRQVEWPNDFGVARNMSKEGVTTDWIFWIDADEILVCGDRLRKYLDTKINNAYIVTQNHLILDVKEMPPDTPNRLIRNNPAYNFVGSIHEHPEDISKGAFDNPIMPTMMLPDTWIVHYGYTTEAVRRDKCGMRNLPLLLKDIEKNPKRKLNKVLLMRDYINLTNWTLEDKRGLTNREVDFLRGVVTIYKQNNMGNPNYQYAQLGEPFYQQALAIMGTYGIPSVSGMVPFQVSLQLVASVGGLRMNPNQVAPSLVWFETKEDYELFMEDQKNRLTTALNLPSSTPQDVNEITDKAIYETIKNTGRIPIKI